MALPVSQYEDAYGVGYLENASNPVMLQIGAPATSSLAKVASLLKESATHRFQSIDRRTAQSLQYGRFEGDPYFIEELWKFLSENYRCPVYKEDLFVSNGASAGFWEMLHQFFRPGDTIFVEDPSYKTLLPYLQASVFDVISIPTDGNGMLLDQFENKLRELSAKTTTKRYPFRAGVYLIPICHNPVTRTMPEDHMRKFIELARTYDLLLMSDDVYNLLWYGDMESDHEATAKPPRRLYSFDDKLDPDYKGNVVSIGSFSKLLGPGLRLGWFEMPPKLQSIFRDSFVMSSGSGKSPFLSGIVAAGLELGLVQKHVKTMKRIYFEKMQKVHGIVTNSLTKHGVKCALPNAGYFLWIILPEDVATEDVLELSKKEVMVFPGSKCSLLGSCKNCMRLSISFYEPEVLYRATQKLCGFIVDAITKAK